MGERRSSDLGVRFDARLRLEFHGAKVVTHSRRIVFQMAEVAVPRWGHHPVRIGANLQHPSLAGGRKSGKDRQMFTPRKEKPLYVEFPLEDV